MVSNFHRQLHKVETGSRVAACDTEPEGGKIFEATGKKPSKPNFMKAKVVLPRTPVSKSRYVTARVVSISSSSEDEEPEPARPLERVDPLLYSPIKASHQNDVIDLTLTSSEEEGVSDSDSSEERDVISLLEDSPSATAPRLKRLVKGSRLPGPVLEIETAPTPRSKPGSSSTPLVPAAALPEPHSRTSKASSVLSRLHEDSSEINGDKSKSREPPVYPREMPPKPKFREPSQDSESDAERPSPPRTPIPKNPSKKGKAPRVSKKALEAAEQARREAYAQKLFDELNQSVFKGGLPESTKLTWSKRLLTTAGRARWRRSVSSTPSICIPV